MRVFVVLLVPVAGLSGCLSCEKLCSIHNNGDFQWASDCDFVSIDDTAMTNLDGASAISSTLSVSVSGNEALTDVSGLRNFDAGLISIARNTALEVVTMGPITASSLSFDGNNTRTIELALLGGDVFIREPAIERVTLTGEATSLRFADGIPSEASWDETALGVTSLRVSGVPDATATSLAPLGIASQFIGIYGSGAMQPNTAGVDEYDDALRTAGFVGTLEVCVSLCDSARTPCDDDGRRRLPCDVR